MKWNTLLKNKCKGLLELFTSCLRYHPCAFCCSKPIAIDTKVTLYSIINSSIVPQNLIPRPKSCYQIGDYAVFKYNNS